MTLLERFAERLRFAIERADAGSPGPSYMPTPAGLYAPLLDRVDELAASVVAGVEAYAGELIPDAELRARVLEHPELVARWPLETTAWRRSGEINGALSGLGQFERVERFVIEWPPEVSLVEAAELLERVKDDRAARVIATLLREGRASVYRQNHPARWPGAEPGQTQNSFSYQWKLTAQTLEIPEGEAIPFEIIEQDLAGNRTTRTSTEEEARDRARLEALIRMQIRWHAPSVAVLALVERLVRERSPLYAVGRARQLVRDRYGDKLAGHVRDTLGIEGVSEREALDALESSMRLALDVFAGQLGDEPRTDAEALAERDGMLEIEARFADFLAGTYGDTGKVRAEQVRSKARERLAAYRASATPDAATLAQPWERAWPIVLAGLLWPAVREHIEKARRKPAALVRAVSADLLDLHSRRYELETRSGQRALVFNDHRGWVVVPSLFDGALASILERGVGLLTSQTGIDLLEWEVTEAHRQFSETGGASDFRHITIEGGWAALAHEKLGKRTKKAAEEVRAIVLAQARLEFQAKGYRGNLLSYTEPHAEAPGRRSRVTITLGDMLLAGFTHALREERGATSLASREARRLVPILGKTALVGRRNDYAAQRRMVWRFAMALRDRAEELAERGHVALPLDAWTTLADEAGAPRSGDFIPQVLQAWKKGDERAGVEPLIVQVKGERNGYTLHESRKAALDFIVEGGRRTTKKRAEGKASARKRAEGSHKVRPQKGGA